MAEQEVAGHVTSGESVTTEGQDLLEAILAETTQPEIRDEIGTFWVELEKGTIRLSTNLEASVNQRIAEIDELLSTQLQEIMHHEIFKSLETAWRSLHKLVMECPETTRLEIDVLSATKDELAKDFDITVVADRSTLFREVFAPYSISGGYPYTALICDYYLGPKDVAFMKKVAAVGAASHCMVISSASPALVGLAGWEQLPQARNLAGKQKGAEFDDWRTARTQEDFKYLMLASNRTLLRSPYKPGGLQTEGFNFHEGVGKNHEDFSWGSTAFCIAKCIIDAHLKYGWCASIRGMRGGGLVKDLVLDTFTNEEGVLETQCPTDCVIPNHIELELSDLGFVPLVHEMRTSRAAFYSMNTCYKPALTSSDDANANGELSRRAENIMPANQVAHNLMAMARDMWGDPMTKQQCQTEFQTWIETFTNGNPDVGREIKGKYPFSEAKIILDDVPGRPGDYFAKAFLKRHTVLNAISFDISVVARLPGSVKGRG